MMFSMMMLGEDAIAVIMPLIITATHSGLSMRLRFNPVLVEIVKTTGMSMATIAEEFSTDPITPASSMMSATSRVSLPPPARTTSSPRRCVTPVFTNPALTMKMAASRITTGEPKPDSASVGVSTLLVMSAATTSSPTMSARGRPQANSATATASTAKTIHIW
jgi:hypothetical protein